jgi:hypothetical protein
MTMPDLKCERFHFGRLSDEEVLFLTDILPTGYAAIDWAQLKGGEDCVKVVLKP